MPRLEPGSLKCQSTALATMPQADNRLKGCRLKFQKVCNLKHFRFRLYTANLDVRLVKH